MKKCALILLAMAGIYVWIRRQQQTTAPADKASPAESGWANEGGNHPAADV